MALLQIVMLLFISVCAFCYPPTCYTRVLNLGKEITERAQRMKKLPDTERCTAHLPDLYIDVHMCHGELVFYTDDCAELNRKATIPT
ncbi:cytokine-like protein 1 [Huso huso]|uniref:Cytokine-like protein 1 n=1 Tax=Huso huso TaxID=61971 RepID=A0ABR0YQU4_HUSHU